MPMNYRTELRRPISLALLGVALLGWLLTLAIWTSFSSTLRSARSEIQRLQTSESNTRAQLDEHRRVSGSLADIQARAGDVQRQASQLTEARDQAQRQLTTLQQSFEATQRQLAQGTQARDELQSELSRLEQALRGT